MHQLHVHFARLKLVKGCVSVRVQSFTERCSDYWKMIFRLVFSMDDNNRNASINQSTDQSVCRPLNWATLKAYVVEMQVT